MRAFSNCTWFCRRVNACVPPPRTSCQNGKGTPVSPSPTCSKPPSSFAEESNANSTTRISSGHHRSPSSSSFYSPPSSSISSSSAPQPSAAGVTALDEEEPKNSNHCYVSEDVPLCFYSDSPSTSDGTSYYSASGVSESWAGDPGARGFVVQPAPRPATPTSFTTQEVGYVIR